MPSPGGLGQHFFGFRTFGVGGPLAVSRAGAIASQVLRVVFNIEPQHRSAAGGSDALNPSNYVITVPGGNAVAPVALAIDTALVTGPTYLVAAGQFAMDVHVDRGLIFGVVYNVRVRNVVASSSGGLGSPDNANFGGVVKVQEAKITQRNQDLIDLKTPPDTAVLSFVGGDIAVDTPDGGTRTRIFRRLFTQKDAFRFLKGYGTDQDLKKLATTARLASFKTDGTNQIKQEPDVAAVSMGLEQHANGLIVVTPRARTKRGTFVDIAGQVTAEGQVSVV